MENITKDEKLPVVYRRESVKMIGEFRTFVAIRKELINQRGIKCEECGIEFDNAQRLDVDHTMPIFFCGKNDFNNLRLLCHKCHDKKSIIDRRVAFIASKVGIVHRGGGGYYRYASEDEVKVFYQYISKMIPRIDLIREERW